MSVKVSTSEKESNFGPWNVPEEINTRDKGFVPLSNYPRMGETRNERRPASAAPNRMQLYHKGSTGNTRSAHLLAIQPSDCVQSTAIKQSSEPALSSSSENSSHINNSTLAKDTKKKDSPLTTTAKKPPGPNLDIASNKIAILTRQSNAMQRQSQHALSRLTTQIRENEHATRKQRQYHRKSPRKRFPMGKEALAALHTASTSSTSLSAPPSKSQSPKRSESEPQNLKPAQVTPSKHPNRPRKKKHVSFLLPGRTTVTPNCSPRETDTDVSDHGDSAKGTYASTEQSPSISPRSESSFERPTASNHKPTSSSLKQPVALISKQSSTSEQPSASIMIKSFMGQLLDMDSNEASEQPFFTTTSGTSSVTKLPSRELMTQNSVLKRAPVIIVNPDGTKSQTVPNQRSQSINLSKYPYRVNKVPTKLMQAGSAGRPKTPIRCKSVSPTRPKSAPVKSSSPKRNVGKKIELHSSLSKDAAAVTERLTTDVVRRRKSPRGRPRYASTITQVKYPTHINTQQQADLSKRMIKHRWNRLSLKQAGKAQKSTTVQSVQDETAKDQKHGQAKKTHSIKKARSASPTRKQRAGSAKPHSASPKRGGRRKKSPQEKPARSHLFGRPSHHPHTLGPSQVEKDNKETDKQDVGPPKPARTTATPTVKRRKHNRTHLITELENMTAYRLYSDKLVDET